MKADPLAIVELAYHFEGAEDTWLAKLAVAVAQALDMRGGSAYSFVSYRPTTRPVTAWCGTQDCDPRFVAYTAAAHSPGLPQAMADLAYGHGNMLTGTREHLGAAFGHFENATAAVGAPDALTFLCIDAAGKGAAFVHGVPDFVSVAPRTRALWSQVAAHVCAGLRLRRALRLAAPNQVTTTDVLDVSDAILEPNGRVAHLASGAESDVEVFRDAVKRIERAKSSETRRHPEGALDLWSCLFSGEYSVVDTFDTDGKRLFVAKRNPANAHGPRALTLRERQVIALAALGKAYKHIAYELGISEGTVGNYLHQGLRKLGLSDVSDLGLLVKALDEGE